MTSFASLSSISLPMKMIPATKLLRAQRVSIYTWWEGLKFCLLETLLDSKPCAFFRQALQTLQFCPSHVHDRACCKYQPDRQKMIKPNPKPALIWNVLETKAKHQSHSAFGAPGIRYATCPQTVWGAAMNRLTWNWAAMTCVQKRTSEIPSRPFFAVFWPRRPSSCQIPQLLFTKSEFQQKRAIQELPLFASQLPPICPIHP